jgi:hypothetical protein
METEAYNSGWLAGYDQLVRELDDGFDGRIPDWLLAVIGGKRAVRRARKQAAEEWEDDELNTWELKQYERGQDAGYGELLDDIREAYEKKQMPLPGFLQEIVGEGLE